MTPECSSNSWGGEGGGGLKKQYPDFDFDFLTGSREIQKMRGE